MYIKDIKLQINKSFRKVWIDNQGTQQPKTYVTSRCQARTEFKRNFFTFLVISEWNNLPENIKAAE